MTINDRIRKLEDYVLPEHPEPVVLTISNDAEVALYKKAQAIRLRLQPALEQIIYDETLTFDQQIQKLHDFYEAVEPDEKLVLTKDTHFLKVRLYGLLFEYFKPIFPKISENEIRLRILWFFDDMLKLAVSENMIDSEWNHNRNEDDPNFDDIKWWEHMDSLIAKQFPDGLFTVKTYEKVRDWLDEREAELIREYWVKHPKEKEEFFKKLEARLKATKE